MSVASIIPKVLPDWAGRALSQCVTYALMSLVILALDYVTGPFVLFPIFFVLPVALAAWFKSSRLAYSLAALLPAGRLLMGLYIDTHLSSPYNIANAVIQVAVLLFIAYFVGQCSKQSRELNDRVNSFVTMCAWSRTIEYQGEWLSFEDYLKIRFNVDTSHGISPAEAEKVRGEIKKLNTGAEPC